MSAVSTQAVTLDVGLIDANPLNPRRIDLEDAGVKADLLELGRNLVAAGQFIEVRVRPHATAAGRYELVDGERRWRACLLVGKLSLRCLLGDFTDAHVLVLALALGGNQSALNPMERADGYAKALSIPGMSLEKLAAQTGHSVAAIHRIVALRNLPKRSRRMVAAGVMSQTLAWLIARVPSEDMRLQVEAAVAPSEDGISMLSKRAAEELIKSKFSRSLHRAPFDTEDAELLEDVGACGACPYRAGSNVEFYGDVQNPHTCMRPECFGRKAAAAKAEALLDAEDDDVERDHDLTSLSAEENERVFPAGEVGVAAESGYVCFSRPMPADLIKPEVVAAGAPKVCDVTAGLLVRLGTDQAGRTVEVVPVGEMVRAVTEPDILRKEVVQRYGKPVGEVGEDAKPKSKPVKGSLADEQSADAKARAAADRQAGKKRRAAAEWLHRLFDATCVVGPVWSEYTLWSLAYEHMMETIEDADAQLVLRAVSYMDAVAKEAKSELKTFAAGLKSWQELRGLVLVMMWGPSVAVSSTEEPWVVDIHKNLVEPQEAAAAEEAA